MTRIEKQICDWIKRHLLAISIVVATLLSLYARYVMRGFISRDMRVSLIPWFNQIQSGGGIAALKEPVGNYNIPYQTLIAFMTYIPINPIYQYKILSMIFDFFQAFLVSKMVGKATQSKALMTVTYIIAIFLPTVLLNSSLWGQCDSIYTSFCLLSLLFLLDKKYNWSFISFGVAFAFKLQAVFFLPFMLFICVKDREFSFAKFLWIPIVMIMLSLVGVFSGQPLSNVFTIYVGQTTIGSMSVNYPSIWAMMIENYGRDNVDHYNELHIYAIALTIAILLVLMIVLFRSKKIDRSKYTEIAFLLVYTTVFFLPNMHERYGYLYIILGGIVVCSNKKIMPIYIILLVLDMVIYGNYLFELKPNWQVLATINFVTYCYCVYCIVKSFIMELSNCSEKAEL